MNSSYLLCAGCAAGGISMCLGGCGAPAVPIGDPLPGLSGEEIRRFNEGRVVFVRSFTPEEGLGPLFNAASCLDCHVEPVTGGSSAVFEIHATAFAPPDGCDPLFEEGGPVVQLRATPALQALGVEREAVPASATGEARRTSPPLFGLGLVDAIPEATILSREDPDDRDGDGISGRANRFPDGRLGRFGRKAFIPSLFEFNAGAFPIEQGVTTPLSPLEETLNGVPVPASADPAPDPEIGLDDVERVDDFVRFLAPPARRTPHDRHERRLVERGERLFAKVGCAACHVPAMKTAPSDIAALDRRTVALYSDLLLHDMGPALADVCLGVATPAEFRTEMLMGLRFRRQLLHDGSATSVHEAIERHGGEGSAARDAFRSLDEHDRRALLRFLDSL